MTMTPLPPFDEVSRDGERAVCETVIWLTIVALSVYLLVVPPKQHSTYKVPRRCDATRCWNSSGTIK